MLSSPASRHRIPLLDVRVGGPVEHARRSHRTMLELRDACFSIVPGSLRTIARPLDRISAAWLRRTPSPYVDEIAGIASLAGRPGIWFVNASYEWGCTTRVDTEPTPFLRRTLDWPFPGLGRYVEVALQDGGAGLYANVTWPGAVGVLTAVAPGRFAAAINQAPMFRRSNSKALLPIDFVLNGVETWRRTQCWPPAHLLRHVFDSSDSYDEAVEVLTRTPLAKPVLFSVVGCEHGQGCLIERTETDAHVHSRGCTIANEWHPSGPARAGKWLNRGALIRGPWDSEQRRTLLESCAPVDHFDWLVEPVLNDLTRLAIETSPATGALRVVGFEPETGWMTSVRQATEILDVVIAQDGSSVASIAA
jgi:hypothetical protein